MIDVEGLPEHQAEIIRRLAALSQDASLADVEMVAKFREIVREESERPDVSETTLRILADVAVNFEISLIGLGFFDFDMPDHVMSRLVELADLPPSDKGESN